MELRQLEHFIAVAEERSFTRAALRLNMAQSAISASVRALERDLGTELLHRTTQSVRLSAAGETLLPQARKILADVADASDLVADVQAGVRGTLTIGTMQALVAGPVQIAPLLAALREAHPLLEIRLRQATRGSAELAEEMLEGRIDVAVLALPGRATG